jgi:hypothetical protein
MTKPKLILFQVPYQTESLFHSTWFAPIIDKYFSVEQYQQGQHYPANAVFVMGCNGYLDSERRKHFENRRVIVDSLWESNTGKWAGCFHNSNHNHLIFYGNQKNAQDPRLQFVPNWFWYNESLWYRHRGYHGMTFDRTYNKKFLMPLGKSRGWRTELINAMGSRLDDAFWSYTAEGQLLPGTKTAKKLDHRWINPAWFNQTCFSVAAESFREPASAVTFLTEKTYKVIAGQHPFMIYGASGALELLREQGFETFDNLFDESYDTAADFETKIKIICSNIDRFEKRPHDTVTLEKISHNFNRFYNRDVVEQGIYRDIIKPIQEWI